MSLATQQGADDASAIIDTQVAKQEAQQPIDPPSALASALAQAYLDYSKTGTLPGADLTAGGTKSLLDAAFSSDNTSASIDALAQGIADYWATNNALGSPAHGGLSVISVVIPTGSFLTDFKNAILSILTDTSVADGWFNFYDAVEGVLTGATCTITELMPGSPPFPQAFSETIS